MWLAGAGAGSSGRWLSYRGDLLICKYDHQKEGERRARARGRGGEGG